MPGGPGTRIPGLAPVAVSDQELLYIDGLISNAQAQINGKAAASDVANSCQYLGGTGGTATAYTITASGLILDPLPTDNPGPSYVTHLPRFWLCLHTACGVDATLSINGGTPMYIYLVWPGGLTLANDLATFGYYEFILIPSYPGSSSWIAFCLSRAPLRATNMPSGIDAPKLADGSVSNTEFQYINSLSSNAQTQLDGKQAILSSSNKLSILALPLALAAAGPDLLSTYEAELAGACPWYCPSPGAETVTKVMDSTAPGGVCWHFESTGDQASYEIPVRIPVQTDKAYTLSIWTKAGANDSISYCGLNCYAGDGTSLGIRYCCKHGGGNNASWTRLENCITGEGTMGYPTYQFPVGTKYVQIWLCPMTVYTGPRDIYVAAPAFREVERGNYSDAGGTADALTVNPYPQWTSYFNNAVIRFKAASNNTGSATINVSGIGDLTLYKHGRVPLAANDLIAGAIYEAHYSTVNSGTMQLMSTPIVHSTGNVSGGSAPALAAAGVGGTNQPASATQSGWLAIADTAGVVRYVPCWT